MADATGYDPKAVQAASGWSVLYAVKTAGDPGFLPAYATDGSGNASDTTTGLAVDANRARYCATVAPDYVESDV